MTEDDVLDQPPPKRPRPADEQAAARPDGSADSSPAAAALMRETANPHAKRKVAMLVAYNGVGYSGLQKNPDVVTIESTLEGAIHAVGGISDDNFGTLQKVGWSRAGRTDKGVHALGQIISLKMILSPDRILERINEKLDGTSIRVLAFERTNNNFCAHTMCSSREYEYMLPATVLHCAHAGAVDGEATDAAAGDEHAPTAAAVARLEALLRKLEGTHSFHNFTDGKLSYRDASAQRFMISITSGEPVSVGGVAYLPLRFHGQSFLLHQIRKMVAMLVATFRGDVPADAIEVALGATRVANIPMAPSCALVLRRCRYEQYERKRMREFPERQSVHFAECDSDKDRFMREHIVPHVSQCVAEGEFARFSEALAAYRMERPAACEASAPEVDGEAGHEVSASGV